MPKKYVMREHKDETYSIKLDGNERNSRVDLTENQADKLVHQFAENRNVYVEYAGSDGRIPASARSASKIRIRQG